MSVPALTRASPGQAGCRPPHPPGTASFSVSGEEDKAGARAVLPALQALALPSREAEKALWRQELLGCCAPPLTLGPQLE